MMGYEIYTKEAWKELVCLDYVLIWNYTDDYDRDLARYHEIITDPKSYSQPHESPIKTPTHD